MPLRTFTVCATRTSIYVKNFFITPSGKFPTWRLESMSPGGPGLSGCFGEHLLEAEGSQLRIQRNGRGSMASLCFSIFGWCFFGEVLHFCSVPPGTSLGYIPFVLWGNFECLYILKHLWVSCLGNFLDNYWGSLRIFQSWEKTRRCLHMWRVDGIHVYDIYGIST